MVFRWIVQSPGKPLRRGTSLPPADTPAQGEILHLVSPEGSMALFGTGMLYENGQLASPGEYRAQFEDGALVLLVGEGGVVLERRQEEVSIGG